MLIICEIVCGVVRATSIITVLLSSPVVLRIRVVKGKVKELTSNLGPGRTKKLKVNPFKTNQLST